MSTSPVQYTQAQQKSVITAPSSSHPYPFLLLERIQNQFTLNVLLQSDGSLQGTITTSNDCFAAPLKGFPNRLSSSQLTIALVTLGKSSLAWNGFYIQLSHGLQGGGDNRDSKKLSLFRAQPKPVAVVQKKVVALPQSIPTIDDATRASLRQGLREAYGRNAYLTYTIVQGQMEISKAFVNLALVKEDLQREHEKDVLRDSGIPSLVKNERIHKPSENVPLTQLFDPRNGQEIKRLYIEGRAGIGKSTFSHYIAHLWSVLGEKELVDKLGAWTGKFTYLLWVPLRELYGYHKLSDEPLTILAHLLKDKYLLDLEVPQIESFLKEDREDVLYILDGIDEVPEESDKTSIDSRAFKTASYLLQKKPYWIATSRHGYFPREKIEHCKRLENLGFQDIDIPIYVDSFFKSMGDENGTEKLLALLRKENSPLHAMAHIPINLDLLCTHFLHHSEQTEKMETLSDVYEGISSELLLRFLKKFKGLEISLPIETIWEHHMCRDLIQTLETIAWNAIWKKTVVIKPENYLSSLPNDKKFVQDIFTGLGFLKPTGQHYNDPSRMDYYFIHLTFQEYLAARHLKRLLIEGNKSAQHLITHHSAERFLLQTFIFTASLFANDKSNVNAFFDALLGGGLISFHNGALAARCLNEALSKPDMEGTLANTAHEANTIKFFNNCVETISRYEEDSSEDYILSVDYTNPILLRLGNCKILWEKQIFSYKKIFLEINELITNQYYRGSYAPRINLDDLFEGFFDPEYITSKIGELLHFVRGSGGKIEPFIHYFLEAFTTDFRYREALAECLFSEGYLPVDVAKILLDLTEDDKLGNAARAVLASAKAIPPELAGRVMAKVKANLSSDEKTSFIRCLGGFYKDTDGLVDFIHSQINIDQLNRPFYLQSLLKIGATDEKTTRLIIESLNLEHPRVLISLENLTAANESIIRNIIPLVDNKHTYLAAIKCLSHLSWEKEWKALIENEFPNVSALIQSKRQEAETVGVQWTDFFDED